MKNSRSICVLAALGFSGAALLALARAPKNTVEAAAKNAPKSASLAPLRVLVVGGGPNLDNNQVAIESNVRYLNRLLSAKTPRTVLFADGKVQRETVLFDRREKLSRGERLVQLIWNDDGPQEIFSSWRRPQLGSACDGASQKANINRAFAKIRREAPRPLLLYFTGHGSPTQSNSDDNVYDLWDSETLSVRGLAKQIARLPRQTPVTIVMVQCFSGAFANLIFRDGDPKKPLEKRDIAGFFATTKTRYAAGCTSAVDEAEYRDFTSYFFAALSGRDRVGRKIGGADFNRDGRVGMDEAFYFTVANDQSIDVPVATSDAFLRRFVTSNKSSTRYSAIWNGASPAQRFALNKLSGELNLKGENRLRQAQQKLENGDLSLSQIAANLISDSAIARAKARFENLRHLQRVRLLKLDGNLRSDDDALHTIARNKLMAQLEREGNAEPWKELSNSHNEWQKLESEKSQRDAAQEIRQAHLLRFINLHESVALHLKLQRSSNARLKNRFAHLLKLEAQTLLPPLE